MEQRRRATGTIQDLQRETMADGRAYARFTLKRAGGARLVCVAGGELAETLAALPRDRDVLLRGYHDGDTFRVATVLGVALAAAPADVPARPAASARPAVHGEIPVNTRLADLDASDLTRLVWSLPVRELAQRLGVSDVAINKRCRKLAIATPARGFWARVAAGHRPHPQGVPQVA